MVVEALQVAAADVERGREAADFVLRLQDADAVPPGGELQRGGQAGEAGADDHGVDRLLGAERRRGGRGVDGGGHRATPETAAAAGRWALGTGSMRSRTT